MVERLKDVPSNVVAAGDRPEGGYETVLKRLGHESGWLPRA
jgi:hypothetical protein